jgi:hypothetical protein
MQSYSELDSACICIDQKGVESAEHGQQGQGKDKASAHASWATQIVEIDASEHRVIIASSPLYAGAQWCLMRCPHHPCWRSTPARNLQVVWRALPRRCHPQFRDKNRRDIGKSQSQWTVYEMQTPGSPSRSTCPCRY